MAIDFVSPSMRATASDLTIQISPLGLVELSDEEFDVHGPRMARYATLWAMYLGHHWSYQREDIETQMTVNYSRAFSDYLTNFTFSKGLQFSTARMYQHIIPSLLERIWNVDNNKLQTLWEIGNQGSVSGDAFVKVAYEPAFTNPAGRPVQGKLKILPLNSAYCFPEWHPHDRSRLVRFKQKYRFWATGPDGTRQVFTYVEILTEDTISEYVNDELIDERPNPLGEIPIVHIANTMVSSSPWGLADIQDVSQLNRNYNEVLSEIAEIVKYHAAPITVVTGAKLANMEKGANKVWAGLPEKAQVFNLDGGAPGLPQAIEFLEKLKQAMHELAGVPEHALGEAQPVSNTSGVALQIQHHPLIQKYEHKKMQYEAGLKKVCEYALKTLFLFEPEAVFYNPDTEGIWEEGMPNVLDPNDPLIYQIDLVWPSPLPVDRILKLQEIQLLIQLQLESRIGALRELGEEFPDEKLRELFEEQKDEMMQKAALNVISSQADAASMALTGIAPDGTPVHPDGTPKDGGTLSEGPGGENSPNATPDRSTASPLPGLPTGNPGQITNQVVDMAYSPKQGKRRPPGDK